ncbi:MAG: hypothetical protein LBM99_02830 [Bacillales bacterium]|jgi:hypothetical protein|nr:hypothetical protein [Bacillales bacterium]
MGKEYFFAQNNNTNEKIYLNKYLKRKLTFLIIKKVLFVLLLLVLPMFLFLGVLYLGREHFLIPFFHFNFKSRCLYIFLLSAIIVTSVWVSFFIKKTRYIASFILKNGFVYILIFLMFISIFDNITYSYTRSSGDYMHISNHDKKYIMRYDYFDLFPTNTDKGTLDFYFYYSDFGFVSNFLIDFTIKYDNDIFYNEEVDRLNIFSVNHELAFEDNMAYFPRSSLTNYGFVLNEESKSIKYFATNHYGETIYYEQYIERINKYTILY